MSFWEAIARLRRRSVTPRRNPQFPGVEDLGDAVMVHVLCDRCREVIGVRLRKSSDIQRAFDEGESAFFVQKTVVGNGCFNRIELRLDFDERYRPVAVKATGGRLVEPGAAAGPDDASAPS